MPKIISPFTGTDPTAQILENLGKSLFGGNTAANALIRAKQRAADMENVGKAGLANLLAAGGGYGALRSNQGQANALLGGDVDALLNLSRGDAAVRFGGDSPQAFDTGIGSKFMNNQQAAAAVDQEVPRLRRRDHAA